MTTDNWQPKSDMRILSILIAFFFISLPGLSQAPLPIHPIPTEEQLAWHEMEMNAFIHFSINTFTGKEWGNGDESPSLFNPTHFDPLQWTQLFREVGFRGLILTAKHHDGFCLWPTKYSTHSIRHSLFKNGNGDVVGEVANACKQHGLKFGIYVSPWDRNHAAYGRRDYIHYYRKQLKELFSNYAPVFEMWFDGANGGTGYYGGANESRKIDGRTYYDWQVTIDSVRSWQKDVIFFSDAGPGVRWVGNERGIAGETNWNLIDADTLYAGKHGIEKILNTGSETGKFWVPAETDVSIRPGWFYRASEDDKVKTPQQLFDIYLTSVGRGSTLLLNIPPDKRGLIHENDIRSLLGFKKLIDSTFRRNLALHAPVSTSHWRNNSPEFSPNNMTDGNKSTYWATDDDSMNGSFTVTLGNAKPVHYIVLQEFIRLGQRVKSFSIDAFVDGEWKKIFEGTTIGYKRIASVSPIITHRIRVNILASRACPLISNLEIY